MESEEKMKEDFLICLLVDVLEPLDQGFNIVKANVKWELKKRMIFSVKRGNECADQIEWRGKSSQA